MITLSTAQKTLQAAAMLAGIDGGGAAGSLEIQTAGGSALITYALPYPSGDVVDGDLVLRAITPAIASAGGTAAQAVIKDSAGAVRVTGDVTTTAGSGFVKLGSLTVVQGDAYPVASAVMEF